MKPYNAQTPILLLTGFLGSGKTTLLRELLQDPQLADTAVLVNEVGAVGLDHHLVWGASESMVLLENGCVCCSMRDDFLGALADLFWNRLNRKIPRFSRVVIETTGVADPAPIVQALMGDAFLVERYRLQSVLTTVDATLADRQLQRHREAIRQIAAADTLLITKVDLAHATEVARLEQRLEQLNPLAVRRRVAHGKVAPEVLFGAPSAEIPRAVAASSPAPLSPKFLAAPAASGPARVLHDGGVGTFALRFHHALERERLLYALGHVLAQYSDRLLRVKGLVDLIGEARPTVVQAVGGTLFPLQTLPAWPDGRAEGALAFITAALDPQPVYADLARHLPGAASLLR